MKRAPRSRFDDKTLRFNEDSSFRISVFSDLHFSGGKFLTPSMLVSYNAYGKMLTGFGFQMRLETH